MFRTYFLPVISLVGIVFACSSSPRQQGDRSADPVAQPSAAPFSAYIAGAGIVESSSENIQIGTPVAGIVMEIPVKVGSEVKQGDPLFLIDARELQAQLLVKQAALKSAQEEANVQAPTWPTIVTMAMWQEIADKGAVSKEELDTRRYAVQKSEAAHAKSLAEIVSAEAEIAQVRTELDRRIVRARLTAKCCRSNPPRRVCAGERRCHAARRHGEREDAGRANRYRRKRCLAARPKAEAVAYVRGNNKISTPLTLERVEPYIVPKKSLTGDSTERVDTRVLQVLYRFERKDLPIYVGQQMDVYVKDLVTPTTQPTSSAGAAK